MFELTNAQRACFGLMPVEGSWKRITPKPSPYDQHTTVAYLDGTVIRKYIETGDNLYREYELCEQLSDDLRFLLPKTSKGKPVLLSSASLQKRTGLGMCLSYTRHSSGYAYIDVFHHNSQRSYYSNEYEPMQSAGIRDFQQWVASWCSETTAEDLTDLAQFSAQPRQHVHFREGDVFRFKINRRLYGYGRILLDYARMRKEKKPFWDILMGKPVICSVYHIATAEKNVSVEALARLKSLPSVKIMDNHLFYGTYEIIGNIPVEETEDYPILYGNSLRLHDHAVMLQCGKLYRRIENADALYDDFTNNGIGFSLGFHLPVLLACIRKGSNTPYWAQDHWAVRCDLRNPKFRLQLARICRQFGIEPSQLVK